MSTKTFPRGEGGPAGAGSDEERRNLKHENIVSLKGTVSDIYPFILKFLVILQGAFLIRPCGAPSPRGKVFSPHLVPFNVPLNNRYVIGGVKTPPYERER